MGNRPKPTKLRLIEGNRGHRPIPNSPQPSSMKKLPSAPRHLDKIAKREWHIRGKELFKLGLITIIDLPALEALCEWYSEWRQAKTFTAKKEAAHQMRMFMMEFGMTPSSRARVNVERIRDTKSEWDDLIGAR